MDVKQFLSLNLKNSLGWRTNRKLIVFAVDDYGNVRVASKKARNKLDQAGQKKFLRFDEFDSLENRADLEFLFETLSSVTDSKGNKAVFTAFAVPCNIDFEEMAKNSNTHYCYELLPQTFAKLSSEDTAYNGTWELWKEGIRKRLLIPQFHGREHINLKILKEKLKNRDKEVLTDLENKCYTSISHTGYHTIDWSAAFDFWDVEELKEFDSIIEDGLNNFEKVFGFRAVHFNSPGSSENKYIHESLFKNGIRYIDTPFIKKEHQGNGAYKTEINYTGKKNIPGMIYNLRNVVFEPTEKKGVDWISFTLKQIETAFFWKRAAVISSHRVNYCGNISEENRLTGITSLKKLLKEILSRWPDAEFISSDELMEIVGKR